MKNRTLNLSVSLLVLIISLAGVWKLVENERDKRYRIHREAVQEKLSTIRARLEEGLDTRLNLVYGLRAFVKARPDFSESEFQLFASNLLHGQPGVRSIQLAPEAVVRWVYPLKGNEAVVGHDLLNDPLRRAAVLEAIETRRFVVSGPINLIQGGRALIGRLPIYASDIPVLSQDSAKRSFWGFSTVLVDVDTLLSEAGVFDNHGLLIALRGRMGERLKSSATDGVYGPQDIFNQDAVVRNIRLPYGEWEIAAMPAEGWYESYAGLMAIWFPGTVFALALALFIAYILREPERLNRIVEARTRDLQRKTEALSRNEALLRSLLDSIPDLIYVRDNEKRIILCNDAFLKCIGLPRERVIGRTPEEISSLEGISSSFQCVMEYGRSGTIPLKTENRILTAGGEARLIETLQMGYRDAEGRSLGVVSVGRDITERHEAQQRIRKNESRYRSMIEGLQDVVFHMEYPSGKVDYIGPAVQRQFGFQPSDFYREVLHPADVLADEYRERFEKAWKRLAAGHEPTTVQYGITDAWGRSRWVALSIRVVKNDADEVVGVEGICRDITESVMLDRTLDKISKALSRQVGDDYFNVLVRELSELLGVQHVFVGEVNRQGTRVQTIAVAVEGEPRPNFTYELEGTPCKELVNSAETCHFAGDLQARFPDDVLLKDLGVNHYLGAPLLCANGTVCGLLAVMSEAPINNPSLVAQVLKVFASRASSEIERRRTIDTMQSLSRAVEQSPVSVLITDVDGRISYANQACTRISGYSLPEVIGRNPRIFKSGVHDTSFYRQMWKTLKTEGEWHGELCNKRKDGQLYWMMSSIYSIHDAFGRTTQFVGLQEDITLRKQELERLQLAQTVFEHAPEAIMVTDADNIIRMINPAFSRITGYEPEDVVGKKPAIMKSGRHPANFYKKMFEALATHGRWEGEIWNRRKNGEIYPEWLQIVQLRDASGQVQQNVAIFNDITRRKQDEELIFKQANYDLLTGLPNRSLFMDRLRAAIAHAHREGTSLAVIYLDLDGFKWVNETYGHEAGDQFLRIISKRICTTVRESDTVGRLSADHFIIALNDLNGVNDVEKAVQHLIRAVKEPIQFEDMEAYVTASIGITLCPDDATDPHILLRNADSAMHQAKMYGQEWCFFTEEINQRARRRMELESEMRAGLINNEFQVHLQPIVEVESETLTGCEALARWYHPGQGIVSPGEFIPVAEETGLIKDIGLVVLNHAINTLEDWSGGPLDGVYMSVNLSPVQCADRDHMEEMFSLLAAHESVCRHLVFEITETVLAGDNHDVPQSLLELKKLGARLAIDDFGTGYSSLSYLTRFKVDILKVDQSFVRDLQHSHSARELVRAVIALSHSLGLKVVCEGVETEAQLTHLAEMGCDLVQGFYYGKPAPVARFGTPDTGRWETKARDWTI